MPGRTYKPRFCEECPCYAVLTCGHHHRRMRFDPAKERPEWCRVVEVRVEEEELWKG